VTAHGITDNWVKKDRVLAVREFPGSHSGKNIAKLIKEILSEWEIDEKVHIFLSDSAANMRLVNLPL
jgi:hypothetical protein